MTKVSLDSLESFCSSIFCVQLPSELNSARFSHQVKPPSPVRAPPVPHFGLPFKPRLPEHHHVEACPFSFEERERERRALKEKRLAELRNEEVGAASGVS